MAAIIIVEKKPKTTVETIMEELSKLVPLCFNHQLR